MPSFSRLIKKTFIGMMVLLQVFFYPTSAMVSAQSNEEGATDPAASQIEPAEPVTADNQEEEPSPPPDTTPGTLVVENQVLVEESVTPPPLTGPTGPVGPQGPTGPQAPTGPTTPVGPQEPNGAASSTFIKNEETGLWENGYYTWDAATGITRPKTAQNYSYNPQTNMWDTKEWRFDAAAGVYVENIRTVARPPQGARLIGPASRMNALGSAVGNANSSTAYNGFYDATISNTIDSYAYSGNAGVLQNTSGGSALSGDALGILNLINLLQSSWGLSSEEIATFIANIDGDVVGDLYLDPSQLNNADLSVAGSSDSDLQLTVNSNAQVNNDVNLEVGSGDSNVEGNTTAGNARTGSATAVVNVINMINAIIAARQSFVGVVNINGNLDGDILLPPWLVDYIIANNKAGASTVNGSLDANLNDSQSINNEINLAAASGQANSTSNTSAGSSSTGDARTNLVLLNLTGRQVVASNALLVFVNVLGTWVGLIMDAPAGSTAAALGGGVGSSSTTPLASNADVDINSNNEINNNINVSAASGDATVSNNTSAGNAESGNASAAANILNISNSSFSLSSWFGVLFINVLGSWNGSFGVNTAAGNRPAAGGSQNGEGGRGSGALSFIPDAASAQPSVSRVGGTTSRFASSFGSADFGEVAGVNEQAGQISSTNTGPVFNSGDFLPDSSSTQQSSSRNAWVAPIVAGTLALILVAGERLLGILRQRKSG